MSHVRGAATVRVPASSANLGAGFDCLAVAVERWLEARVEVLDPAPAPAGEADVRVARAGELAALSDAEGRQDLLYVGFAAACAARARPVPARLAFSATSEIPVARGLGSSAAAVVAGARLANTLLGLGLDDAGLAMVGTGVEGHPDNVAAAVFGGAVLSVRAAGVDSSHGAAGYLFAHVEVHPSLAFALAVPDFETSTAAARAALPASLPHAVATAAAAKGAALVHGLATGHAGLLRAALDDVLHVPYRRGQLRGYAAVAAAATSAGAHGATLSGSGSTMLALCPAEAVAAVAEAMCDAWRREGVAARPIVARRPCAVPGAMA